MRDPPQRPVALVESASLPEQSLQVTRLDRLGAIAAARGSGPAIIVLGEVLRERAGAHARLGELLRKAG